jgi:hypothetical protein
MGNVTEREETRGTGAAFKVTAALLLVGLMAGLFWLAFHRAPPPAPPPLPVPNGYDDLVAAGQSASKFQGHVETATVEDLRKFVEENRGALDLVRLGLSRECRVPIEYSEVDLSPHVQRTSAIWHAFEPLSAQASLEEKEGRSGKAAEINLELVRLGVEAARGGLLIDDMIGMSIQGMGLTSLRKLEARLSAVELRSLIAVYEKLQASLEPWEEVEAREDAWSRAVTPLWQRIYIAIYFRELGDRIRKRHGNTAARHALVRVDLALHLHKLEKGAYPRVLADLVPGFLGAVPLDPITGKPLRYTPTREGYSLQSAGPEGKGDGGLRNDWPPFAGN